MRALWLSTVTAIGTILVVWSLLAIYGCCQPSMTVPQPTFVPTPENMQMEQPQIPTNYPLMVLACPGCGGPPQFNTFRVIPLGGDFFQFRSP